MYVAFFVGFPIKIVMTCKQTKYKLLNIKTVNNMDWNKVYTKGPFFLKKIQDWILKSERSENGFCVSLPNRLTESKISSIMVCQRNGRIHSQRGLFGSFVAPWSEKSWIDLFSKETQNPLSDSIGFKNLKETYPKPVQVLVEAVFPTCPLYI